MKSNLFFIHTQLHVFPWHEGVREGGREMREWGREVRVKGRHLMKWDTSRNFDSVLSLFCEHLSLPKWFAHEQMYFQQQTCKHINKTQAILYDVQKCIENIFLASLWQWNSLVCISACVSDSILLLSSSALILLLLLYWYFSVVSLCLALSLSLCPSPTCGDRYCR